MTHENNPFAGLEDLPDAWGYPGSSKLFQPAFEQLSDSDAADLLHSLEQFEILDEQTLYNLLASLGSTITLDELYLIHRPLVPAAWVCVDGGLTLTKPFNSFKIRDLANALSDARISLGAPVDDWFVALHFDMNNVCDITAWAKEVADVLKGGVPSNESVALGASEYMAFEETVAKLTSGQVLDSADLLMLGQLGKSHKARL